MPRKIKVHLGKFTKNIEGVNYDTAVYRCLHFERLLEILLTKKLLLAKTKTWDDSYENFLFRTTFKMGSNVTSLIDQIDSLYGQCWSKKRESDAIWRIYSATMQSVIIKSKISKLAAAPMEKGALEDPDNISRIVIAPVKYYSSRKIQELINAHRSEPFINPNKAFDSLFVKRTEFRHESEVRIIIQTYLQNPEEYPNFEDRKFIKIKIDPNDFIDEIILDPRLSDNQFNLYKGAIRALGFKGKLTKSRLYEIYRGDSS